MPPAPRHTRQPALFVPPRPKRPERNQGPRPLQRDDRAQAAIASFQFLACQSIADSTQPGAAVTFKMHTQQAKIGDCGNKLAGEGASFEVLTDNGQDTLLYVLTHGISHHPLLLRATVVQVIKISCR